MTFLVSPGINASEIDLTTVTPAISTTEGAFAGVFTWGPVNEPVLITSEIDLIKRYGKPITGFNVETFFTAADFLSYGNALYISRANTGSAATANVDILGDIVLGFQGKYLGNKANDLKIIVTGKDAYPSSNSGIITLTQREPSTANNIHIAVIDTAGNFGPANSVLEVFENLSINPSDKTEDGTNNFVVDAVNNKSAYIQIISSTSLELLDSADVSVTLANGTNGNSESNVSLGIITSAYDVFASADNIDISLLVSGKAKGTNGVELANYLVDNIAEKRKDCVVFVSPRKEDVVDTNTQMNNVITFSNNLRKSSYMFLDSGYKYRYDKYNDRYIWTPLNGDMAGLCVRTDYTRDPWFSPAGYNRGNVKNIVKLAYNPNQSDRDQLYKSDINAVISQPGQGTLLFGDKTHLGKDSAFDRINVRRLFIILEKSVIRAAKQTLFEFNDEYTRAQFKNIVEPFLRNIQGRRGIFEFKVVCDETNNTPDIIDANKFVADIYVKPTRSINYIQLNFIPTRTGVEFEEIVGIR